MQALRLETAEADFDEVCSVVESNPNYPFPGFGNTFPKEKSQIPNPNLRRLKPMKDTREVKLAVSRINRHSDLIHSALSDIASINESICNRKLDKAENDIAIHKEKYGKSFLSLKKEAIVTVEKSGLSGLSKKYEELVGDAKNTAWSWLCCYAYDLADPSFDPDTAVRKWFTATRKKIEIGEWYARPMNDDIITMLTKEEHLSSIVLRSGALSLIDLCIQLWTKHIAYPDNQAVSAGVKKIDKKLLDLLEEKYTSISLRVPSIYSFSKTSPSDIEIYRVSFFFSEIASVIKWRCAINRFLWPGTFEVPYLSDQGTCGLLDQAALRIARNPMIVQQCLGELKSWETGILSQDTAVSDQNFLKIVLTIEALGKVADGENTVADEIAMLLTGADGIHQYVSRARFKRLLKADISIEWPLLSLIINELIYRKSRNQDDELERRLAFMKFYEDSGCSNLVDFLNKILDIDQGVALFVARICTRTFLERLYLLMTSVKDVIEARISVCNWLSNQANKTDDSITEELDNLNREFANLEARSDLDSTRVHVDEDSLREWFREVQAANVNRYLQNVLSEDPAAGYKPLLAWYQSLDKHNAEGDDFSEETQVGSAIFLLQIFQETFKTFARDRTFGLDAYLSRRIRHGTLIGQIMTPVNRVLKKFEDATTAYAEDHSVDGIVKLRDTFHKYLTQKLDAVRKDIIQIKDDEHKNGLIWADWRVTSNLTHIDAMVSRVRARVLELRGAYDPFPDLFALCWDCLEVDLSRLRQYLARDLFTETVSVLYLNYMGLTSEEQGFCGAFVREIENTLRARIEEVVGWFIRPIFRRDRYNLKMLVTSSLSVIRELDVKYAFEESIDISEEITLNRGGFDVFGDMLFSLLGNAAKHGKPNGLIEVAADYASGRTDVVVMRVASRVADRNAYDVAIDRITSALSGLEAETIDKAAVQEGFSGLRKLVGVLQRVKSPDVRLGMMSTEEELKIEFLIALPGEITFARGRT